MSYIYGTGANANYSGRVLVYPDQVPFDTDVLRSDQYRMVDISNLAQTILGLPSSFGGSYPAFSSGICTQNASPNLTVQVGVSTLYMIENMEPAPDGSLPAITSINIFKQFSNMVSFNSSTLGTITAPVTVGQSQYYLIQGAPQTTAINNVNRPYYNPSNPTAPNFNVAPDTYIDNIVFSLVAGTPATTGTETIPSPTGGNIGMFVIHVTHGQTTILNANISGYPGSFINETLTEKISQATADGRYAQITAVQNNTLLFGADTSVSANTLTVALSPAITSYVQGQTYYVLIANTNTGATVVNFNALGNKAVTLMDTSALVGGELPAGMVAELSYDGTRFQLLNPFITKANYQVSSSSGNFTTTSGSLVAVTNLTVTITTHGNPVVLSLQPDGNTTVSDFSALISSSSSNYILMGFFRGVTQINQAYFGTGGGSIASVPPGAMTYIDHPAAGTYTYTFQVASNVGGQSVFVNYATLNAYEMK